MAETTTETRLGKLETEFAIVKHDVTAIGRSLSDFRNEWSEKAEEDRKAHRSARLTFPQIATLMFGAISTTAILLGGLWFVINMQVGAASASFAAQLAAGRQSAEAAVAQVALSVRGQGESMTALNTSFQNMQRDQAADRVRLGLVEQMATANNRFIDQAQSFDAHMARNDERLKAMEQTMRDLAARKPPS